MARRISGNEYRSTLVCIDGYENGVPSGRFYNSFLKDGESFESLMQFLLKMERLHDEMKLPQAYAAIRTFSSPPVPAATSPPVHDQLSGELATFTIKILFRQNSSWQGSVFWLEGGREQSFRSVLELLVLIDSALAPEQSEITSA